MKFHAMNVCLFYEKTSAGVVGKLQALLVLALVVLIFDLDQLRFTTEAAYTWVADNKPLVTKNCQTSILSGC